MEFSTPAAAGALMTVPVILGLYLLKIRRPKISVGSLFLWPGYIADRQADMPWKRLRPSWLLLVQLLLAGLLALALMRPGLVGATDAASTTVVLLEGSPSMEATDVSPSRFQEAIARAGRLVDRLHGPQEMALVLLGKHARLLSPATGDVSALRAALARARPAGEVANLGEGLSLANALLRGRAGGAIVMYGDGHAQAPSSTPRLFAPFRYESIGKSDDNVSIESIDRSADDVFVRVANHGEAMRDLRVQLRADGRLVDAVPLQVEGTSTAQLTWSGLPAGTESLEARLEPGDALSLDDRAWLITAAPPLRRVLLVTPGNGFLTRALSLRSELDITVVPPAAYQGGSYDLFVFDGFVPSGPLPHPALVIAPPEGTGPVPSGAPIVPGELLPVDPREPLLEFVSLTDVHVQAAAAVSVPSDWRTIIGSTNGPLLMVHQGEPRVAQLNFDIHRSDLPLRAAFPVLIQNLTSHLLPAVVTAQALPLGEPVTLVDEPGMTSAEVTTPEGRPVRLHPPFPTTFSDTSRPGIYSLTRTGPHSSSTTRFAVQLQDPSQSRIAPGPEPVVTTMGRLTQGTSARLEIWPWLALVALLGLFIEWAVFLRG